MGICFIHSENVGLRPSHKTYLDHRINVDTSTAPSKASQHIDGIVQDSSISNALAMELLHPCTKPSTWWRHRLETFSASLALCHRSPVNSPHKSQRRGALMFSLICAWINCWVNNREAGDLIRDRAHCDVTLMVSCHIITFGSSD